MSVSISRVDHRPCPACGAEVISELWLILHRHERPKLWQRAASLRILTCPNGHSGPVRAPLLLFDPTSPIVIYSPGDESDPQHVRAEGDYLMSLLLESLPSGPKAAPLTVECVPADILPVVLDLPLFNLGDFAPGAPASEEALRICSEIRSGRASPDHLRLWLKDEQLHPALRAGIRFELASYLGREGLTDPRLIEEAILEWRHVLRLYPRASNPRFWAIGQIELAFCYAHRGEANHGANRREALRLLNIALEILSADAYPEDFALAHSRKADLLLDMGYSTALVTESLSCFQSALSVYTKESYFEDWALILSNMATAYLGRAGPTGFDDLRNAVTLLEQVLSVRKRQYSPSSRAITLMNLGLALSRLPVSDTGDENGRAIGALRAAYELFSVLGDTARRLMAAYNLGITLAHSADSTTAEEACERLSECVPWLIETNQKEQFDEAIDFMSRAFMTSLRSGPDAESGNSICRRALAVLQGHVENDSAMQALHHIGVWFLDHASTRPDNLALAGGAFERVFTSLQAPEYAEVRAAALANFATVMLQKKEGVRELNRVRAHDSLDEALRVLRSLPSTAERDERIGIILMNRMLSDFGPGGSIR